MFILGVVSNEKGFVLLFVGVFCVMINVGMGVNYSVLFYDLERNGFFFNEIFKG